MENITITLPNFPQIEINILLDGSGGTINSNLADEPTEDNELFNAGIDAMESLILAYAVAGGDVTSVMFVEAIETALDAVINHS